MKWTPGGLGKHIEDRRGSSGGGMGMAPMGIGGTIILLVLGLVFGVDLTGSGSGGPPIPNSSGGEVGAPITESAEEAQLSQFISFVNDDVQDETWSKILPGYRPTTTVLYRQGTNTGCGYGQSAAGPFYCPADEKVYLDLGFFAEMKSRLGAGGDFAQAYVVAHEIAHHVQHQTGIAGQMRNSGGNENAKSVQLELQADCLAGVWGNSAAKRDKLDAGDMEEGLRAASSIGDDVLQRQSTGMVRPESFTHGSAAQRTAALRRGLQSGDPNQCAIGSF
jgi:predicted metalloprotease